MSMLATTDNDPVQTQWTAELRVRVESDPGGSCGVQVDIAQAAQVPPGLSLDSLAWVLQDAVDGWMEDHESAWAAPWSGVRE